MNNRWTQYSSESVAELKRITANNPGREDRCMALLTAAKDSGAFLAYVRSLLEGTEILQPDGDKLPDFPKISEGEFKNLPWNPHGNNLWEAMGRLKPIDASLPGLWLYLTLHAIEHRVIESHFLASGLNGTNDTGKSRIDKALQNSDELVSSGSVMVPRYLDTSRLILRRMFGAISERGIKAIFVEVPFAKIWWQQYIAHQIAEETDIAANKMVSFLVDNKAIYSDLTMYMSGKLTVIGDRVVRDGLMDFFFNAAKENVGDKEKPEGFTTTGKNFRMLIRRLGVILSWRAMGILNVAENRQTAYECAAEIGRGEFASW